MAPDPDGQAQADRPNDLGDVLEQVDECARQSTEVSIGDLVASAGQSTFAPLILVPGLIMLAPGIGDIPGVPVLMGLLVILVVVQMLMKRRHLWLPDWLQRRSVRASRVHTTWGGCESRADSSTGGHAAASRGRCAMADS